MDTQNGSQRHGRPNIRSRRMSYVSLSFSLSDKHGLQVRLHETGTEIDMDVMEVEIEATVTVIPKSIHQKRLMHVQLKPSKAHIY